MMQILIQSVFNDATCTPNEELTNQFNQINDYYAENNFTENNIFTVPCGVQKIDSQIQLYKSKNQLVGIIIPDTVVEISVNAFKDCQNLLSFNMPDSVETMGNNVFQGCKRLQYVKLSNKLQTIPANTFRDVENLRYIELPNDVKSIQENAFTGVISLGCVAIPYGDCQIAENAFDEGVQQQVAHLGSETACQDYHIQTVDCDELNTVIYTIDPKQCINHEQYETYTYIVDNENKYFVQRCLSTEFISQLTGTAQCQDTCPETLKYYEPGTNNMCVESCNQNRQYYIQKGSLYECSYKCENEWAVKIGTEKECVQECTFYLDTIYQVNFCIEDCNETYKYISYYQNSERIQCLESCTFSIDSPYYLQEEKYCLTSCTGDYANPENGYQNNTCSNTCKFYIDIESNIKHCSETCTNIQNIEVQSERKQCVSQCSEALDTSFKYYQDYTCVQSCDTKYSFIQEDVCVYGCTGLYGEPYEGNVCDNTCNIELSGTNKKRQCVNDCNKNQFKTEIAENRYQCSESCNEIIIPNREYQQGKTCVETCQGEWALPVNGVGKVCSDTCNYYVLEATLQKQCIASGNQCPQGLDFMIERGNRLECIKECDKDHQYMQGQVCTEKCTYPYAKQLQESKICHDSCTFKINQAYAPDAEAFCVQHNQCDSSKGEITISIDQNTFVRRQCVTSCNQSVVQELKYQQENQCVAKCDSFWYKNQDNSNICLNKSCSQQQLVAYDFQTLQCNTLDVCEQYYHVFSQADDVNCFFNEQVESCTQLVKGQEEYFQDYKYVMDQSKECVPCSGSDYKVKDEEDLICQTNSSNKTGAIAGGVVAAVVVVIIIIVVIIICVKKNQKKSQQNDIEMQNNQTEQQVAPQVQKQEEQVIQQTVEPVEPAQPVEQVQQPIEAPVEQPIEQQQVPQAQEVQQEVNQEPVQEPVQDQQPAQETVQPVQEPVQEQAQQPAEQDIQVAPEAAQDVQQQEQNQEQQNQNDNQ